tara:strand:- start:1260 stop:1454 length:195 start_codon:yes stop_codon:yes gene_type:complete
MLELEGRFDPLNGLFRLVAVNGENIEATLLIITLAVPLKKLVGNASDFFLFSMPDGFFSQTISR